jgi:hypothetical protein
MTLLLQKNIGQSCERDDEHHFQKRVLHLLVHLSAPELVVGKGDNELFSVPLQEPPDEGLHEKLGLRRIV